MYQLMRWHRKERCRRSKKKTHPVWQAIDDERILGCTHDQGFYDQQENENDVKAFECDEIGDGDIVSGPRTTR